MDAVNAFNTELFSMIDIAPPISRAKMMSVTKSAIKAIKLYKHVVQIVERFVKKCKPDLKIPGLYVIDSIVRQSRHQFGIEKDVFGPRFLKNFTNTFENICQCPEDDRDKIVRVLNLWQKNGVFDMDIIQALMDMANGSTVSPPIEEDPVFIQPEVQPVVSNAPAFPVVSNAPAFPVVSNAPSFPVVSNPPAFPNVSNPPAFPVVSKAPTLPVVSNAPSFPVRNAPAFPVVSKAPTLPIVSNAPSFPVRNAPAFPIVNNAPTFPIRNAPSFPVRNAPAFPIVNNAPTFPVRNAPSFPVVSNAPTFPVVSNAPAFPVSNAPPLPVVSNAPSLPIVSNAPAFPVAPQSTTSNALSAVAKLLQSPHGQELQRMLQNLQTVEKPLGAPSVNSVPNFQKKSSLAEKLLDRFDYDDEPEEETVTETIVQSQGIPENVYNQLLQMANANQQAQQAQETMIQETNDTKFPVVDEQQPIGQDHMLPNDRFPVNTANQSQESSREGSSMRDRRRSYSRRSRSGSRSPRRRRKSRSPSPSRRSWHRRSRSRERRSREERSREGRSREGSSRDGRAREGRSRSRERRRRSRSRSQARRDREKERVDREKDRARQQKGLPSLKNQTLSVCTTTLWVGNLDKKIQQIDVMSLLEEFGPIDSINMIPPRGCAYIVMLHRLDAYTALNKLSRGSSLVNQKPVKIAWALNKGINVAHKKFWDVERGVTYIPWSEVKAEELHGYVQGGMLDIETLNPEWNKANEFCSPASVNGTVKEVLREAISANVQEPPVHPQEPVKVELPVPVRVRLSPPPFPPRGTPFTPSDFDAVKRGAGEGVTPSQEPMDISQGEEDPPTNAPTNTSTHAETGNPLGPPMPPPPPMINIPNLPHLQEPINTPTTNAPTGNQFGPPTAPPTVLNQPNLPDLQGPTNTPTTNAETGNSLGPPTTPPTVSNQPNLPDLQGPTNTPTTNAETGNQLWPPSAQSPNQSNCPDLQGPMNTETGNDLGSPNATSPMINMPNLPHLQGPINTQTGNNLVPPNAPSPMLNMPNLPHMQGPRPGMSPMQSPPAMASPHPFLANLNIPRLPQQMMSGRPMLPIERLRLQMAFAPGGNQFPQGANQFPHGGNQFPQGANQFPHGGNQFPHGGNQFPHGGNQFPHGGNQFPHGGNQFPHGGNQFANQFPRGPSMRPEMMNENFGRFFRNERPRFGFPTFSRGRW